MCRLFAIQANRASRVSASLLSDPHSLRRQSCCDASKRTHDSGWGIGYYHAGRPYRVRSSRPCGEDAGYDELAATLVAPLVLAHVRLASVGAVAEQNAHPFLHGRWLFAHNGTLFGFAAHPERLLRLIPAHLRRSVEGVTDSEFAFHLLLARLEQLPDTLGRRGHTEAVGQVFHDTIRTLADLFPGEGDDSSQVNCVLTDGEMLLASRWGHTLFWLERNGHVPVEGDAPVEPTLSYHAIAVASEPTTSEPWLELPDRSVLQVNADLTHAIKPIVE